MIKAIIFDFDGVLVESAPIKTGAFRILFSKWPDKVDEIISYHISNMGISRYVKFKHFYENILGEPYSDEIGEELGKQFSEVVLEEIKKAPLVNGTKKFLDENFHDYLLFIASGTPQEELNNIVSFKWLSQYFKGIFGTPLTKTEIIKNILRNYNLNNKEVVFVGDAESDKIAAKNSGINFIAKLTNVNTSLNNEKWKITDMTEIKSVINMLNQIKDGVNL